MVFRRSPFLLLLASVLSSTAVLSACGNTDSSAKIEKNEPLSVKEEGILRIAHATESGGDLGNAEELYKQAVTMSGKKIGARIELAEFYKRNHADKAAIKILNEVRQLQPRNVDVLRELANTYINAGSPDKALMVLDDAIAINSKDPLLYNSKGVALDMLGKYAEAQKSYQTALLLNPDDDMTFKGNLSMSYILSGAYNKAIALLLPLLNSPDVTPNIRQNLALAYGLKGESSQALRLGLKDLSIKEAQENLKFYRMLATTQGDDAKPKADKFIPVEEKPARRVQETPPENPFLEDDERDNAEAVKPVPIPVQEIVVKPVTVKSVPLKPVSNKEEEETDEEPVTATPTTVIKQTNRPVVKAPEVSYKAVPLENDNDDAPAADDSGALAIPHNALPSPVLKPDRP